MWLAAFSPAWLSRPTYEQEPSSPRHWDVVRQQNLPDKLVGRRYYVPTEQGFERTIAERLRKMREEMETPDDQ
ncbi:MAG: hypothetical protein Q8P50_14530 [Bacillota bacterium]|nr:hypothetical protein [Bacillota bacterium]